MEDEYLERIQKIYFWINKNFYEILSVMIILVMLGYILI